MGTTKAALNYKIGWQNVDNEVEVNAINGSFIHTFQSSEKKKTKRQTRALNVELKKFGSLMSYSDYVKTKTKILRDFTDNEDTTDQDTDFSPRNSRLGELRSAKSKKTPRAKKKAGNIVEKTLSVRSVDRNLASFNESPSTSRNRNQSIDADENCGRLSSFISKKTPRAKMKEGNIVKKTLSVKSVKPNLTSFNESPSTSTNHVESIEAEEKSILEVPDENCGGSPSLISKKTTKAKKKEKSIFDKTLSVKSEVKKNVTALLNESPSNSTNNVESREVEGESISEVPDKNSGESPPAKSKKSPRAKNIIKKTLSVKSVKKSVTALLNELPIDSRNNVESIEAEEKSISEVPDENCSKSPFSKSKKSPRGKNIIEKTLAVKSVKKNVTSSLNESPSSSKNDEESIEADKKPISEENRSQSPFSESKKSPRAKKKEENIGKTVSVKSVKRNLTASLDESTSTSRNDEKSVEGEEKLISKVPDESCGDSSPKSKKSTKAKKKEKDIDENHEELIGEEKKLDSKVSGEENCQTKSRPNQPISKVPVEENCSQSPPPKSKKSIIAKKEEENIVEMLLSTKSPKKNASLNTGRNHDKLIEVEKKLGSEVPVEENRSQSPKSKKSPKAKKKEENIVEKTVSVETVKRNLTASLNESPSGSRNDEKSIEAEEQLISEVPDKSCGESPSPKSEKSTKAKNIVKKALSVTRVKRDLTSVLDESPSADENHEESIEEEKKTESNVSAEENCQTKIRPSQPIITSTEIVKANYTIVPGDIEASNELSPDAKSVSRTKLIHLSPFKRKHIVNEKFIASGINSTSQVIDDDDESNESIHLSEKTTKLPTASSTSQTISDPSDNDQSIHDTKPTKRTDNDEGKDDTHDSSDTDVSIPDRNLNNHDDDENNSNDPSDNDECIPDPTLNNHENGEGNSNDPSDNDESISDLRDRENDDDEEEEKDSDIDSNTPTVIKSVDKSIRQQIREQENIVWYTNTKAIVNKHLFDDSNKQEELEDDVEEAETERRDSTKASDEPPQPVVTARPVELHEYISREGLVVSEDLPTLTSKKLQKTIQNNEDEEIWLMEIPRSIINDGDNGLCGKTIKLKAGKLKIDNIKYETSFKVEKSLSCILRPKKKPQYKIVNIEAVGHMVVGRKSSSHEIKAKAPECDYDKRSHAPPPLFPKNLKSRDPLDGLDEPLNSSSHKVSSSSPLKRKRTKDNKFWNIDNFVSHKKAKLSTHNVL